MCDLSQSSNFLMETFDIWDTALIDESALISSLSLEVHSAVVPVEGKEIAPGQSLTIGRTSDSDLRVLADRKLSRVHFSITCNEKSAVLQDLDSSNGTYLNGQHALKETLRDGDQIIAGTTCFTVRIQHKTK